MDNLVTKISAELKINSVHAGHAIKLLFEEECTIPFVARYRKEMTGSMDEVVLRDLRDRYEFHKDLEATKTRYIKVVEEHCKSNPELAKQFAEIKARFEACETKQALEDLYLPYKPKRRTRAQAAKEKGLEPLLEQILQEKSSSVDLVAMAQAFVATLPVPEGQAPLTAEEALAGASDILAEQINETPEYRAIVRERSFATGKIVSTKHEGYEGLVEKTENKKPSSKKDAQKFENYFNYSESIANALSHRIMAVRRGEAEKILRVSIEVDDVGILKELTRSVLANETSGAKAWIEAATEDAYKRLISPSVETEIRVFLKNKAEEEAIKVFSSNLSNLLMLPPIPKVVVMGVDPGLRTGSKIAVVSQTGALFEQTTVYPNLRNENDKATLEVVQKISELINKYKVGYIAIGNGTGSREIDQVVIRAIRDSKTDVKRVIVNEAGASVYSTDAIAREEFPDLDPTIRSAISIARRLQDPLAELVKIEPRSIGVGQYQHDCNAIKLSDSLKETVESCVNNVGVNVNSASYKLLGYVSGIGPSLAKNLVTYRDSNGPFESRESLKAVKGFGAKCFQQATGFLRVPESQNPLDNSAVHPEHYGIVENIAKDLGVPVSDLIGKKELIDSIALEKYATEEVGVVTLRDIAKELVKPGRDPRAEGSQLTFSDKVSRIEDLTIGMKLKGTVSNVTAFGAFVDIGVHQDGLVHVSELSNDFVKDPTSVVSVGKVVDVYVLDVDIARKRISLSCKTPKGEVAQKGKPQQSEPRREPQQQPRRDQNIHLKKNERQGGQGGGRRPYDNKPQAPAKHYSVGDLLSKFNSRST